MHGTREVRTAHNNDKYRRRLECSAKDVVVLLGFLRLFRTKLSPVLYPIVTPLCKAGKESTVSASRPKCLEWEQGMPAMVEEPAQTDR